MYENLCVDEDVAANPIVASLLINVMSQN